MTSPKPADLAAQKKINAVARPMLAEHLRPAPTPAEVREAVLTLQKYVDTCNGTPLARVYATLLSYILDLPPMPHEYPELGHLSRQFISDALDFAHNCGFGREAHEIMTAFWNSKKAKPAPLCPVDGEALRPHCVHAVCPHQSRGEINCGLLKPAPSGFRTPCGYDGPEGCWGCEMEVGCRYTNKPAHQKFIDWHARYQERAERVCELLLEIEAMKKPAPELGGGLEGVIQRAYALNAIPGSAKFETLQEDARYLADTVRALANENAGRRIHEEQLLEAERLFIDQVCALNAQNAELAAEVERLKKEAGK